MARCDLDECNDRATHLVVYKPVGDDRERERYCKIHAELAADEAREDKFGELFLGPQRR